ncbi:multiple epidermal growth factor-like domains protein 11 isoform X2 [Saccostrea cucullata]|uniref:multiple epidermal growth factor-like domains protein 11 isoform X2 n=1 Tax=Saccostrea cuccullata TaxID=36930 RepID=UPI002ED5F715
MNTCYVFPLILCLVLPPVFNMSSCDGNNGCCLNYYWNEIFQNCSECPAGFTGLNCSVMCGYPSYGEKCEKSCECLQEDCNFQLGCLHVTSALYSSTFYVKVNWTDWIEKKNKNNSKENISSLNILSLCILIMFVIIVIILGIARLRKYISKRNLNHSEEIHQNESHYQEIPNDLVLTSITVDKVGCSDDQT